MVKKYCVFRVYDYKGGELGSSLNLSFDMLIGELSELFEGVTFYDIAERRDKKIRKVLDDKDKSSDIDEIKKKLKEYMKSEDFPCIYAGGDCRFCGKIYEVEDNTLKEVFIESYLGDIAEFINNEYLSKDLQW